MMRSMSSVFGEHQQLGLHCQTTDHSLMLDEDVRKGRRVPGQWGRKTGIFLISFMDDPLADGH